MKYIFLNLKRFNILREYGEVNGVAPMKKWGSYIVQNTQEKLKAYSAEDVEFVMYSPEARPIPTVKALHEDDLVKIGCQGMHRDNTAESGNFGVFTTNRTANTVKAVGCSSVIIGHCEGHRDKAGILEEAGVAGRDAVGKLLDQEIKAAIQTGLTVLYCIGETAGEQEHWQEVLKSQLKTGLKDVDRERVVIACEPIWAIGSGKTPPSETYITKISTYIEEVTRGVNVVYGDGPKADNTRMLVSVPVMDGGLITLTRLQGQTRSHPEEYLEIACTYLERD